MAFIYEIKDLPITPNHPLINRFLNFGVRVCKKFIEACVSVKVWAFVSVTWVSAYLAMHDKLEGGNFAIIMCTLVTTILAREATKVVNTILSTGKYRQVNGETTESTTNGNGNSADIIKTDSTISTIDGPGNKIINTTTPNE